MTIGMFSRAAAVFQGFFPVQILLSRVFFCVFKQMSNVENMGHVDMKRIHPLHRWIWLEVNGITTWLNGLHGPCNLFSRCYFHYRLWLCSIADRDQIGASWYKCDLLTHVHTRGLENGCGSGHRGIWSMSEGKSK